jgi:hypothetical protein
MPEPQSSLSKQPRVVLEGQPPYTLYAFPPNRDILGGTAYFIVGKDANILIDCPAWNEANLQFLQAQGGVRWLFITHRGGISKHVSEIQQSLGCEIVVQEQEAYLLVKPLRFTQKLKPSGHQAIPLDLLVSIIKLMGVSCSPVGI